MILKTNYYNVRQKNEKLRIYIESQDLNISGFSIGKRYDIKNEITKEQARQSWSQYDSLYGKLILTLNENGKRKVAIRKISATRCQKQACPVLDLQSNLQGFYFGSLAKVEYSENTITITNEKNYSERN